MAFALKRPGLTIDRNCENCGIIFQVLKSTIPPWNKTTAARGRFCSVPCRAEWFKNWNYDAAGKRSPVPKHRRGQGFRI